MAVAIAVLLWMRLAAPATQKIPPPAKSVSKFDDEMFGGDVITPASGDQGDYIASFHGLWLLRGAEAMRVREVERFSTDRAWVPATQGAVRVPVDIRVRQSQD
jgi:hypothetical protein